MLNTAQMIDQINDEDFTATATKVLEILTLPADQVYSIDWESDEDEYEAIKDRYNDLFFESKDWTLVYEDVVNNEGLGRFFKHRTANLIGHLIPDNQISSFWFGLDIYKELFS